MDSVFLGISVLLAASLVVTLGTVLGLLYTMPDVPNRANTTTICLPKNLSGNNKFEFECGDSAELLHQYIQNGIDENYKKLEEEESEKKAMIATTAENVKGLKQFLDKNYWEMKPAARLTGTRQQGQESDEDFSILVQIREWNNNGRQLRDTGGFRRYGMRYRNGRVVVPVSGTYNIYSFVDMHEPCIPPKGVPDIENKNTSIKHAIFKFNILEGAETELVCNVQSHQVSANGYFNIYSSYVSSIVQLNAGDELMVKVSNITYLKYPDVNYFGVNLI